MCVWGGGGGGGGGLVTRFAEKAENFERFCCYECLKKSFHLNAAFLLELPVSHMGKNNENPDPVCEN